VIMYFSVAAATSISADACTVPQASIAKSTSFESPESAQKQHQAVSRRLRLPIPLQKKRVPIAGKAIALRVSSRIQNSLRMLNSNDEKESSCLESILMRGYSLRGPAYVLMTRVKRCRR